MIIIPAIDLMGGQGVRLQKGDFDTKTVYVENPAAFAREIEAAGLTHLHLVDLDGAKSGQGQHLPLAAAIARQTALHVDFGGGIRDTQTLEKVFAAGIPAVTIGSMAVHAKERVLDWVHHYGAHRFIIGLDVRNGEVMTHGWQQGSGERWELLMEFYLKAGVQRFMVTDVARDGMLQGTALDLYEKMLTTFPNIELIASGGVGGMDDLQPLAGIGCYGAIVGKALYENRVTLAELAALQKRSDA